MIRDQIRIWGTVFAALLGLAFGSFLNVCLSRWPEGESIVKPRSYCHKCGHVLAWWENVPLLSWLALRGRCRGCGAWIGWRYVIVEVAVGSVWALEVNRLLPVVLNPTLPGVVLISEVLAVIFMMIFFWFLTALAILDVEHLWLPDWLTWPGIASGIILQFVSLLVFVDSTKSTELPVGIPISHLFDPSLEPLLAPIIAASLILVIRLAYWLVRRREGIGLGDAKLMALLAAWLGLPGALLSFGIAVGLGALVGLAVILAGRQRGIGSLGLLKLPLGTFLCIGGIVTGLWGRQIISAYMRWAGF